MISARGCATNTDDGPKPRTSSARHSLHPRHLPTPNRRHPCPVPQTPNAAHPMRHLSPGGAGPPPGARTPLGTDRPMAARSRPATGGEQTSPQRAVSGLASRTLALHRSWPSRTALQSPANDQTIIVSPNGCTGRGLSGRTGSESCGGLSSTLVSRKGLKSPRIPNCCRVRRDTPDDVSSLTLA